MGLTKLQLLVVVLGRVRIFLLRLELHRVALEAADEGLQHAWNKVQED